MGLFDYVKCDHELFGKHRGEVHQTKEMDNPYMEKYEITPSGRLTHIDVNYEDRSDPKAEGIFALKGCMTPMPTGTKTDMNWHGYLELSCFARCKFTDGQLVAVEFEEK